MVKSIVIVESPTKIKTISKFLGPKFKVLSSMGHLVDLPKSTLGIDIQNNFEPKLIVVRSKSKLLTKLKKDTKSATKIYFATDPDREGEAIGWNLIQHIGEGKEIFRVSFQEITKEAVLKALGTGWRSGIAWTDVEVVLEPSGQPRIELHNRAAEIARELGIATVHISISHTDELATASAIAES